MNRVLLLNHEPVGTRMTGPAIRNWELARQLAGRCAVTLAAPGEPQRTGDGFKVVGIEGGPGSGGIDGLVGAADVVLVSGYLLEKYPSIRAARHLVVDLNGPFTLENLHMHDLETLPDQMRISAHDTRVLTRLIRAGDVFLCSGERQRDFWTGWMAASGRVNPALHAADPALERVFKVVPFGLPDEAPASFPRRYRGVVPGIAEDDFIVMWSSGIWNWFDPLTLLRAVASLQDRLPALRLVFAAPTTASSEVGRMGMAAAARKLADDLGLTGRSVFFGTGMEYEERGSILREADVATSLHLEDVETRYSFRTRMLDWFWAGLPILTTEGDVLSDLVRDEDLGEVVPYADVDAVATAIINLERDRRLLRARASRSQAVADRFRWSQVALPLVEYCEKPYAAPDRSALNALDAELDGGAEPREPEHRRIARRAAQTLREQGAGGLARKGAAYVRGLGRRPPD